MGDISTPRRRSVARHISEWVASVPIGTEATIAQVAMFSSQEYGDDMPSPGAIISRCFPARPQSATLGIEGLECIPPSDGKPARLKKVGTVTPGVSLASVLAHVGEDRVRRHLIEWRDSVEPGYTAPVAEVLSFVGSTFPDGARPPIEAVVALVFSASIDGIDGVTCASDKCLTGYHTTHKFVRRTVTPDWVGRLPDISFG